VQLAQLFIGARNFGWQEGYRRIPEDALLHPSVLERYGHVAVQIHGDMVPYRPRALRKHRAVGMLVRPAATAARPAAPRPQLATTSSVTTLNPASRVSPKLVESATSVASRPRAMRMRPMRGLLWRASKVYQRPSR